MIISISTVKKTRAQVRCGSCEKTLHGQPSIVMFGAAVSGDRPYQIRVCLDCGRQQSQSHNDGRKVLEAVGVLEERLSVVMR